MSKKKGHGGLIAAVMPVLTHGLGKFEHVLEVDLQENDHFLLIDASMELLPHCSSNFDLYPSEI